MTTVSVRLPDATLKAAENGAKALCVPRSEYFRRAIESMNKTMQAQERRQRLMSASQRVREESMVVNAEFAVVEQDVHA